MAAICGHKCTLHLWNLHVPPGSHTTKGSESGGGREATSGSKRFLPRFRDLLMHLREERTGAGHGCERRPAPGTNRPTMEAQSKEGGSIEKQFLQWPGKAWPSTLNPTQYERPPRRGNISFIFIQLVNQNQINICILCQCLSLNKRIKWCPHVC